MYARVVYVYTYIYIDIYIYTRAYLCVWYVCTYFYICIHADSYSSSIVSVHVPGICGGPYFSFPKWMLLRAKLWWESGGSQHRSLVMKGLLART